MHLNFTSPLSGTVIPDRLRDGHDRIMAFLRGGKYRFLLFNPFLRRRFEYSYRAQYEEFLRLYDRPPTHIGWHHHMHLCGNMVVQRLIPLGTRVRTTFSFSGKEKGVLNRGYRRIIEVGLQTLHCTSSLYGMGPLVQSAGTAGGAPGRIIQRAAETSVELIVHPQNQNEFDFLMSDEYAALISKAEKSAMNPSAAPDWGDPFQIGRQRQEHPGLRPPHERDPHGEGRTLLEIEIAPGVPHVGQRPSQDRFGQVEISPAWIVQVNERDDALGGAVDIDGISGVMIIAGRSVRPEKWSR